MSSRFPSKSPQFPRGRLTSMTLRSIAVVAALVLAWWIARPTTPGGSQHASGPNMPRARGPVTAAFCGPSALPRQPPPIDSPFGLHLFATTPLGVIHPLPAMCIADSLMPPESAPGKSTASLPNVTPQNNATSPSLVESPPRNETALDDVESVSLILQEYRRAFGAMPVGEQNEEIVRRLQGENPLGIAVLPKTHPALNSAGELLDRWGTPYRFHPESAWVMTVRSAGPDKRMWTSDDILSTQEGQSAPMGVLAAGME